MLKHNSTYEIMRPETVGLRRSRLVLGKHSGRHALQVRLEELGFNLEHLQVACGTMGMPTATVRLRDQDGNLHVLAAVGTGPVDAAFKAIDTIVQVPNTLLEFSINAVTEGIDAIGEVTVRLEPKNGSIPQRTSPQSGLTHPRSFGGYGADTDIIVACVKAYLSGLNKLLNARDYSQVAELGTVKTKPSEIPN
jgi:2-isopropylmalate synthase